MVGQETGRVRHRFIERFQTRRDHPGKRGEKTDGDETDRGEGQPVIAMEAPARVPIKNGTALISKKFRAVPFFSGNMVEDAHLVISARNEPISGSSRRPAR